MSSKSSQLLDEVLNFVDRSSGLSLKLNPEKIVSILQDVDSRVFSFDSHLLEEVLQRTDSDGKPFLQVNFCSGLKVLFTDTLVGFKPGEVLGLDMNKIPKVVTTPDLLSVFEAIEEGLGSDSTPDHEIEVLKRVFQAILTGGELAGFELGFEKKWLSRLVSIKFRASA
jgi:hypothetical protein